MKCTSCKRKMYKRRLKSGMWEYRCPECGQAVETDFEEIGTSTFSPSFYYNNFYFPAPDNIVWRNNRNKRTTLGIINYAIRETDLIDDIAKRYFGHTQEEIADDIRKALGLMVEKWQNYPSD